MRLNSRTASPGSVFDEKTWFGREKPERVISPIVSKALLQKMPFVDMMVYWHEFHGSDAKIRQMTDGAPVWPGPRIKSRARLPEYRNTVAYSL